MDDTLYTLHRGHLPLLVSVPHAGRDLTPELRERLVPRALGVEDTDWFLEHLYDFARELGASLLVPRYSRYVIDLNRPSDNTPMYPDANNTELCPTRFFTGDPLYRAGQEPTEAEVKQRVQRYWQPYHDAMAAELARLKQLHGRVVLFDGHSIKRELPWLFEGTLPDLNLGTADGNSCDPALRAALAQVLEAQSRFSQVVDGRFKGGQITRSYGQPEHGVHAVQMEMCWHCYMDDPPPFVWNPQRAADAIALLRSLAETMANWAAR